MKYLILMFVFLTGCAYNSTTITAQGNVTCNSSVEKPVNVNPSASVKADGNTVPVSATP